jgi:hypothetical protein
MPGFFSGVGCRVGTASGDGVAESGNHSGAVAVAS